MKHCDYGETKTESEAHDSLAFRFKDLAKHDIVKGSLRRRQGFTLELKRQKLKCRDGSIAGTCGSE